MRPPTSVPEPDLHALQAHGRVSSLEFFGLLRWIDGRPLLDVIEPYRRQIFSSVLDTVNPDGSVRYNLALCGRAKKNWKSADLVLASLFALAANDSAGGNQCYLLANDEGQAGDDLSLAKNLVAADPLLADRVVVRQKLVERADGRGFLEILPAQDVVGTHGKTARLVAFDEVHGYKTWDIFEALALDPTRGCRCRRARLPARCEPRAARRERYRIVHACPGPAREAVGISQGDRSEAVPDRRSGESLESIPTSSAGNRCSRHCG
jgi:hypothetical protein